LEKVSCLGLPNCYRLANDTCEVVFTTDVGPRVAHYGRRGGANILGAVPGVVLTTELGDWKPWGGHRLWAAPEAKPRSYAPDNAPVAFEFDDARTVRLVAPTEEQVGIQKELRLALDAEGTGLTLEHRVTNQGAWPVELAPWAITIMAGGGEVIIPQEPFRTWSQALLPARPFVLWHYTDMSDARFTFGRRYARLRAAADAPDPQKIGALCKLGWAAYLRGDELFVKRFPYEEGAPYPDYGCNVETYTAGDYVELESLAPLTRLEPGATATHTERWYLFAGVEAGLTETALEETIEPLVAATTGV
jgi:hypothetical protein